MGPPSVISSLQAVLPSKHDVQDAVWAAVGRYLPGLELQIDSGGCGLLGDTFMTLDGLLFCDRHARFARASSLGKTIALF